MAANRKEEQGNNKKRHRPNKKGGKSSSDKQPDKKRPPFLDKPGKEGDTKKWDNKTYYWCPAKHKYSHWHTHKIEECKTYQKWRDNGGKKPDEKPASTTKAKVTVNCDKFKKGMAALLPLGEYNLDDLADALDSAISE